MFEKKSSKKKSDPSGPKKGPFVTYQGQLSVHPRGFGFVNLPSPLEDVFVPKSCLEGAIDGDIVEVEVDTSRPFPKGPEGKIARIVERSRKSFAGTVLINQSSEKRLYCPLFAQSVESLPCPTQFKDKSLKTGDRIVFEVKSWEKGKPKKIEIKEFIGSIHSPSSDIPFAIYGHGLRTEFSKGAQKEAKAYGTSIKPSDLKERVDLRKLMCVTIDPDTAKDFDDAISIEKRGMHYRLGVHIADVSHYVRPDMHMDIEASNRCNSTYFPGRALPMLPKELSENLCSLKPNVNRLAVSVFVDINSQGETVSWEIVRSVIRSKKRFTYKEAKAVLYGTKKSKYAPLLKDMVTLCYLLKGRRAERGSVQIFMPEIVVLVDEHGVPKGLEKIEYDITHQMVEECMLKANEVVAIHLSKQGKEVSYRVHEEPSSDSLRDFSSLVASFGHSLPEIPKPQDIQKLFQEIEGTEQAQYLAQCYIKSMRLACYSADNIGHYGLSLEHYCHFTSPIRRYVDTIIHRLLFEKPLSKEEIGNICQKASEKERLSARAEGEVVQLKKLRLLQSMIKEDPNQTFEAIITRVKPFGLYFDVVDLMMEGFLHISELEDDYFLFDESHSSLYGKYRGYTWKSGDTLKVKCRSIDLILLDAKWKLLEKRSNKPIGPLEPHSIRIKKKKRKHERKGP